MNLKTKGVVLVAAVFLAVLGASHLMFHWLARDVMTGLGTLYARKQVLYNRARTLQPLLRELALARKLADSSTVRAWARDEADPGLHVDASGHYYFDDRGETYAGDELRYTLDPDDPEDRWYFRTVASDEPYQLNVDFDEKLGVTKVWVNVVIREAGEALGVLGTGIDLSDFLEAVVSSRQVGVTNVFVEPEGAIQAHDRVELIDFRTISKAPGERKTIFQILDREEDRRRLRRAMDRLRSGGDEVEVVFASVGGQKHLVGLGHLAEIGWYNVTLVDTEEMFGADRFLPFALLLLAALVLLSTALVVFLDRLVFRRISRLDRSVRDFAAGAVPLPTEPAPDEVGRLERGFQQMARTVQEHTEALEEKVADRTRELSEKNERLEHALVDIRTLSGLLPVCMYCKKIRDEAGEWHTMETYITRRSEAEFSHGICPECGEDVRAREDLPTG